MTDREAFIAGIIADPDNDLRRLVFADWLEENGESERAAMIRAHIEAYHIDPVKSEVLGNPQWVDGPHRSGRQDGDFFNLMSIVTAFTCDPEKNGLCPDLLRLAQRNSISWQRGFVTGLRCPVDLWCGATGIGHRLVREHPLARVTLADRRPNGNGPCFWFDDRRDRRAVVSESPYLPAAIYDRIEWTFDLTADPPTSSLGDRDAADDAASIALIEWAKSQPVLRSSPLQDVLALQEMGRRMSQPLA